LKTPIFSLAILTCNFLLQLTQITLSENQKMNWEPKFKSDGRVCDSIKAVLPNSEGWEALQLCASTKKLLPLIF
jgi:hypothetical protein